MNVSLSDIAAEVIRTASRTKPADAALREVLQRCHDLMNEDARAVSRLVFLNYRWHGWTRGERGVEAKLRLARRLAERFQVNSRSFPAAELRANAIPAWVAAEMDVTDDWLRSLQGEPRLWLRAKRAHVHEVQAQLRAVEPFAAELPEAMEYRGEIDLFKTPEFHAGAFEIQDIASQMVGWLCAPKPGETWWDACAGEGGKTLHLSELMANKGLIWASDRAAWRLQKLKRRTARAGVFNYRAELWNGGPKLPTKTRFDGVLVDAPCSGVGTWQRNPHARWTTEPQDVAELAAVQNQLLQHVAPSVKSGGRLIYSVCTLTRQETTAVVAQFSQAHPEFEPLELSLPRAMQSRLPPAAALTIWPQQWGGNGMFVAGWRRR